MGEPKLVKGMLGWAAIGDGLIVYAKTKAAARERFLAAQEAEAAPRTVREDLEQVGTEDLANLERWP